MAKTVSIIICTHNRSAALIPCLTSILQAIDAAPQVDAEILIIDNNSTDNTQDAVATWRVEHPGCNLRVVFEPQKGLSHARNCGLSHATGALLLMIDDDCIMDTNYIANALAHDARDTDPVLRGGSVFLGDPTDQPLTIKTETKHQSWSRKRSSGRHENLGNTLLGCNMMMRKTLVDKIGPFDITLGAGSSIPGGEDTDYIFRTYIHGFEIEYAPDLKIHHFHGRKKVEDGYNLFRNYSIGGGALYAKYLFSHPNMCRQLYWDLKKLPGEWIRKENRFMPEFGFTMTDKIRYSIKGMYAYWLSRLRSRNTTRRKPATR